MLRNKVLITAFVLVLANTPSDNAISQPRETKPITIFAAASLRDALDEAIGELHATTTLRAVAAYAGSSALARQIEAGAPADVFISADESWMDDLAHKSLIAPETRADFLSNRLVLISPKSKPVSLKIGTKFPLAQALGGDRLAVANVDSIPAGRYAKAALLNLGAWHDVKDHLAESENVRAALALVAAGETPLGIVYETDAAAEPRVKIVDEFPVGTHPPIVYPVAVVSATNAREEASRFIAFLKGEAATSIFSRHGFARPSKDTNPEAELNH